MARKYSRKEYLSVKDLEKVLDSCKLNLHQIDEVWPNLFIGNVTGVQRRADMPRDDRYETPPASELQRLLWIKPGASSHLDEVRPGIYIGDMYAAKDKHMLQSLNITYVLNAAHGKFNVNTGASYYRDTKITYRGVEAFDMPSFDLSPFFYTAAKFIKSAMSTPGGKVLVHCAMGLSRSSSLVLAYLMIHEDMTLVEAIKAVAQHRNICPNSGFMEQLRELDKKLHFQRTAL
ncbi:dual specificity protein phosphatase 13B-like isoform X2 [Pseudorasbora parva]|uniref:dual specificity protein phosphatase 13B-like isoform X2 n=1 Tax=Pseudorasbora parva TaxID=51549 RepID=UPI00351F44B2